MEVKDGGSGTTMPKSAQTKSANKTWKKRKNNVQEASPRGLLPPLPALYDYDALRLL
jgi:hypothetical protein